MIRVSTDGPVALIAKEEGREKGVQTADPPRCADSTDPAPLARRCIGLNPGQDDGVDGVRVELLLFGIENDLRYVSCGSGPSGDERLIPDSPPSRAAQRRRTRQGVGHVPTPS
jgi:hypothetical protein